MHIVVCPGIHAPALTDRFIDTLEPVLSKALVFPAERLPVYSPAHVLDFLINSCGKPQQAEAVFLIGFSAGVVGAIGAARTWHKQGGAIRALVALDGWGVPLYADFPIHRLSHDAFTHWSSACLGGGIDSFYADPAVSHLALWEAPQQVNGYQVIQPSGAAGSGQSNGTATTAADFLRSLITRYSVH